MEQSSEDYSNSSNLVETGGGDYARALHNFSPSSGATNTCLSFRAGQIIRTLNKDLSGWWDGELDQQRGWFPSNYVQVCDQQGRSVEPEESHAASVRLRSASTTPTRAAMRASTSSDLSSLPQCLGTVQQAIIALNTAVLAERVPHFQPSTASVISAVRVVLSETACLTRDSPIILAYPSLALSRKTILSSLAALVCQARKASAPTYSATERAEQTQTMMSMAEHVWTGTQTFVKMVIKYTRQEPEPEPAPTPLPTLHIDTQNLEPLRLHPADEDAVGGGSITIRSALQLVDLLTGMHDQLLSTIAAFIGHVHAHTRASHSSSYAYLIDMTRETIERVREVLVVVEAVSTLELLESQMEELNGVRETLYMATTSLVTAARVATGAPNSSTTEEEEKRTLLNSATAVLRSGGDCIAVVKRSLGPLGSSEGFELVLPELVHSAPADSVDRLSVVLERQGSISSAASSLTASPVQLYSAQFESYEGVPMLRGRSASSGNAAHTLSMLGRKATSLSCLRDLYESGTKTPLREHQDDSPVDSSRRPSIPEHAPASNSHRLELRLDSRFTGPTSSPMLVQRSAPAFNSSSARPVLHSRTSSRTSSRDQRSSTSVAMSTSTSDTSPRTSFSTTSDKATPPLPSTDSDVTVQLSAADLTSESTPTRLANASPRPSISSTSSGHLTRDYQAQEIAFNADGHVTGGSLGCLVERMTLHDTTIDLTFSNTFFLTFRMFTTPLELSQVLYSRYGMLPAPELLPEEAREWNALKATPVRLRISNLFKTWLESYWQADTDAVILESLLDFCATQVQHTLASASQRLVDLAHKRMAGPQSPAIGSGERRLKAGKVVEDLGDPYLPFRRSGGPPPPSPLLSKNLLQQLRMSPTRVNIVDLDPLELARQFTIMESRLYCAIRADELLSQDYSGSSHIKAMSSLSTRITGWISETILHEPDTKKRTGLVKHFIKLCEKCLVLNNYNTLLAVLCALNSSNISRLGKTWAGLSSKYRVALDGLRKCTEHSRNYRDYRSRIRAAPTPCLPFLGLFLTDVTFCYEGNPADRASPLEPTLRLINFDRYQKMAKIVGELQRFQVPYNLLEVPEIQSYLEMKLAGLVVGGDMGSLYRQSLAVEPRSTFEGHSSARVFSDPFNWKS